MGKYTGAGIILLAMSALLFTAFNFIPESTMPLCSNNFQCCTCDNADKTEGSISEDYDELYLQENQIISEVWVKAGTGCFQPDGSCYAVVEGGVGYNFVRVERVGNGPACQGISHIEVCYDEVMPSDTPTEEIITETPTETSTLIPTETSTPTPTETPVIYELPTFTPTSDPAQTPTPYPTSSGHGQG